MRRGSNWLMWVVLGLAVFMLAVTVGQVWGSSGTSGYVHCAWLTPWPWSAERGKLTRGFLRRGTP